MQARYDENQTRRDECSECGHNMVSISLQLATETIWVYGELGWI